MAARTVETTITFRHPFVLAALDEPQPRRNLSPGDGGRGD